MNLSSKLQLLTEIQYNSDFEFRGLQDIQQRRFHAGIEGLVRSHNDDDRPIDEQIGTPLPNSDVVITQHDRMMPRNPRIFLGEFVSERAFVAIARKTGAELTVNAITRTDYFARYIEVQEFGLYHFAEKR